MALVILTHLLTVSFPTPMSPQLQTRGISHTFCGNFLWTICVSCRVLCPLFHVKYTMILPVPSSCDASMLSTKSSQDPAGGENFFEVAGAGLSAGWTPFFRDRFGAAPVPLPDCLPRFLPFFAFSDSSNTASRPPMLSRYASSTSSASSRLQSQRSARLHSIVHESKARTGNLLVPKSDQISCPILPI